MFGNRKRKNYISKLKKYLREWDSERHGYVLVLTDGRLIPTNNYAGSIVCLKRGQFAIMIMVIEENT